MGIPVIAYGRSGAGKSYSLKGFGRDELVLFNMLAKPLPFRGGFDKVGNRPEVSELTKNMRAFAKNGYKRICVDDAGYIMTKLFMASHGGKGNSFDMYNEIADSMWQLFNSVIELPDDVIVYFMLHEQSNDYGETKLRTLGKLLDDKVCLEGMCTIVLHAVTDGENHYFRCQAGAGDIAKSPEGMFEGDTIPNDLKAVDTAIREYYQI